MPGPFPAAVTLARDCRATSFDQRRHIELYQGEIVYPLYPGADQDGWDEEWICKLHKHPITLAIKEEDLRE